MAVKERDMATNKIWLLTRYDCQQDIVINKRDMADSEIWLTARYGC